MKQIDNPFAEHQIINNLAEQINPLCYIQRVVPSVFLIF